MGLWGSRHRAGVAWPLPAHGGTPTGPGAGLAGRHGLHWRLPRHRAQYRHGPGPEGRGCSHLQLFRGNWGEGRREPAHPRLAWTGPALPGRAGEAPGPCGPQSTPL